MKREKKKAPARSSPPWSKEEIFTEGDRFFHELITSIERSTQSVDLESYIFRNDPIGARVTDALIEARTRGIAVRVMVDGIGSSGWAADLGAKLSAAGVAIKVYHRLPWERMVEREGARPTLIKLDRFFRRMNRRNHRKLCIIDKTQAFVGSMNICGEHSRELKGDKAWRDTSALVEGPGLPELCYAFTTAWERRWSRRRFPRPRTTGLVRLNTHVRQRRKNYGELLRKIRQAKQRVLVTNPYFVPQTSLIRALCRAARRGCDVRIVVPRNSDVFFIPWIASSFYPKLLKCGVKIFEYRPTMLHAKSMVVDDWFLIGSSNLNHRSVLHDLELDVVLASAPSRKILLDIFEEDCRNSEERTLQEWSNRPFWERIVGRILLGLRYWL